MFLARRCGDEMEPFRLSTYFVRGSPVIVLCIFGRVVVG